MKKKKKEKKKKAVSFSWFFLGLARTILDFSLPSYVPEKRFHYFL
jgi:hypothetical protein